LSSKNSVNGGVFKMKKCYLFALMLALILTCVLPANQSFAANPQLLVDLSSSTGSIKYGATGFLYGLGDEGIPSDNMLTALKPQVAAQKAQWAAAPKWMH
jgi:hypothetical protein